MRLRVGAAFAAQFKDTVAQATQERAVVRHEQHRPLEVAERLEQHFLRGEIEVVRRLVEHQEVRRVEQHARHDETRLLAARERSDLLVGVVTRELEGAGQAAQGTDRLEREVLAQLLLNRQVGIEHVERLLREVAHLEAGAQLHFALVGLDGAGHHLQQRRLARAVLAHDAPAFAAADHHVQVVVHDTRAVGLRDAKQFRHLVARARRRAEVELDDLALLRQFDLLDLVECLDAALHLRGLGGVRGEALDETLLLGQHRLLPRVGRLAIGFADGALALVEVVVAGVAGDFAAVDLGNLSDDAVHEVAIVRGHEQRAASRLKERLEPEDRLDIEVVGRFVHQQNVGFAEQHARHGHAHLPAARERADVAIDPLIVEAEAVEDFAGLRLEGVAAEVVVLLLHFAEAREDRVHLVGARRIFERLLQRFQFVVQVADAATAGNRLVEHRPARHLLDVLAEVADG